MRGSTSDRNLCKDGMIRRVLAPNRELTHTHYQGDRRTIFTCMPSTGIMVMFNLSFKGTCDKKIKIKSKSKQTEGTGLFQPKHSRPSPYVAEVGDDTGSLLLRLPSNSEVFIPRYLRRLIYDSIYAQA